MCVLIRFKSMKWWAQSFIVGIPEIMVGYRDDDGVVSRLESMDVKQLRKESDVSNEILSLLPRSKVLFCC